MTDLDAFLAGIVAEPQNDVRWLVMADWLEENGQSERAELVRIHREMLRTCTKPGDFPERPALHARMMELMRAGVQPCVPQRTIMLPGDVEMKFSFIPPGKFLMGSPETEEDRDDDEHLHEVELTRGFWMGVSPVTQAQWKAVMGTEPSHFKGDTLPMERVSWEDTRSFCVTLRERMGLKVRLPTEAEWEYAARAGTTTSFYWGHELNGTQANCRGTDPYGTTENGPYLEKTTAVGSYVRVSPHPWGLMDVIGNVWEWCEDCDGESLETAIMDPAGPESGSQRVILGWAWRPSYRVSRGGSWISSASYCRSAYRYCWIEPGFFIEDLGFRLAADSLPPSG